MLSFTQRLPLSMIMAYLALDVALKTKNDDTITELMANLMYHWEVLSKPKVPEGK